MVDIVGSVVSSAIGSSKVNAGVPKVAQLDSSQRFSSTLRSAVENAKQVPPPAEASVQKTTEIDAKERARRTLQLDAAKPAQATQGGDSILDGLLKLRGVFDKQQARVNKVMSGPMTDLGTMLNVQMEVVNYSILVDVASKLTGKSTAAFETLMKGQ